MTAGGVIPAPENRPAPSWPVGSLGTGSGEVRFAVRDGCVLIGDIRLRPGDFDNFARLLFRAIDAAETPP